MVGGLNMLFKDKFNDYLDYLAQKGMTQKTVNEHKRMLYGALSHSISEMKISDFRMVDVAKIIEAGKSHGRYGPQRAVVTFKQYLHFLEDSGYNLPVNWRNIRTPRVPQKHVEYLTEEEMNMIRNSIDTTSLPGLRTRALIEVLYDTGMRISEAISLNKSDVNWEGKEARVVNAKTGEVETVYFTDRSLYWLKKYLEARRDDLPALFVSGRGRLLSVTARNYLRVHTKHLPINKHIRHHIFRKTLATTLIRKNADIKTVQTILRHKSERTTLRYYVGVNKERAKKIHQKIMSTL